MKAVKIMQSIPDTGTQRITNHPSIVMKFVFLVLLFVGGAFAGEGPGGDFCNTHCSDSGSDFDSCMKNCDHCVYDAETKSCQSVSDISDIHPFQCAQDVVNMTRYILGNTERDRCTNLLKCGPLAGSFFIVDCILFPSAVIFWWFTNRRNLAVIAHRVYFTEYRQIQ